MSDDMLIHFSSNSSNQSDNSLPTKIAKLEARMVGKASLAAPSPVTTAPPLAQPQQQLPTWSSVPAAVKFVAEDLADPSTSDSDDDNGEEFLIQANAQKRQKFQVEAAADGRQMIVETKQDSRSNSKEHLNNENRVSLEEEVTILRAKVAILDEACGNHVKRPQIIRINAGN